MHSLLFLDPGHFHAALTLRVPQPRAADEVFVYAREGAELRDFLALVERFNRRSPNPTRWRPVVTTADDPLGRLVEERRGDVVVLAGRNWGKARTIRRLHGSGFHVLADKPWLVEPADLEHVRASLKGCAAPARRRPRDALRPSSRRVPENRGRSPSSRSPRTRCWPKPRRGRAPKPRWLGDHRRLPPRESA
jgi:hypothetical protein